MVVASVAVVESLPSYFKGHVGVITATNDDAGAPAA